MERVQVQIEVKVNSGIIGTGHVDPDDFANERKCFKEKWKTELFSKQTKFKTHMIESLDFALIKDQRESEMTRWPMRLV